MRATVDEVGRGRRPPRASTPTSPRAARSPWPAAAPSWPGPGPRSRTPGPGAAARTTSGCSTRRGDGDPARPPAPRGATYTPDCAAIHPARLVRGLADAVERPRRRPSTSSTPVRAIEPGRRRTDRGAVRARDRDPRHRGLHRRPSPASAARWCPVYSLIIATEPLPADVWDEIGLRRRETFTDHRHLIIYGQRTADDRLVFGGRGAPYHFGSRIRPEFDRDERVFAPAATRRWSTCSRCSSGTRVTHAWGGALGIPRDWCASVGLDPATGLGWAGGYVGDGVSTTNLAGRTLRDLVLGRDTELTRLPWVGHRSPAWEPRAAALAGHQRRPARDDAGRRRGAVTRLPSVVARLVSPLLG